MYHFNSLVYFGIKEMKYIFMKNISTKNDKRHFTKSTIFSWFDILWKDTYAHFLFKVVLGRIVCHNKSNFLPFLHTNMKNIFFPFDGGQPVDNYTEQRQDWTECNRLKWWHEFCWRRRWWRNKKMQTMSLKIKLFCK